MAWRARLDRAWTVMVGVAFAVVVPLMIIEKIQDYGWKVPVLFLLACFLAGLWRAWPTHD